MSRYAKNLLLGYTCRGCRFLRIEDGLSMMLGCLWHPFKIVKINDSVCRFYKFSLKKFSEMEGFE